MRGLRFQRCGAIISMPRAANCVRRDRCHKHGRRSHAALSDAVDHGDVPGSRGRRARFFRQPDFVRGRRVKLLSQRNTLAVDHHHPLRALAPRVFPTFEPPLWTGAKLPSRNDSLQSSCSRSFSSARNERPTVSRFLALPGPPAPPASRRRGKFFGQIAPALYQFIDAGQHAAAECKIIARG